MKKLAKQISLLIFLVFGLTTRAESIMSVIADTGRAIPITQVHCLIASDYDSKMSIVLSDGLTIVGVDHVTFGLVDEASIKSPESNAQALMVAQQIIITGAPLGSRLTVGDLYGRVLIGATIEDDPCVINASSLTPNQCYIITINGISTKIIKR